MMESAMTAILRDASGKMHHGILFARRLGGPLELSILSLTSKELGSAQKKIILSLPYRSEPSKDYGKMSLYLFVIGMNF